MNKALFVIPLILTCLLSAIWSGWIRIGFSFPVTSVAAHHGNLMINGFLASLIFLERAVTFRNRMILLLPLLNAASIILLVFHIPYAEYLHLVCSAGFILMCIYFIYRYQELYYYVFLAGAFCLFAGNFVLYRSHMYPASVTWWMEFLLFTIVAERLELTQFLPLNRKKKTLLVTALVCVFISGLIPFHLYGNIAFAISLTIVSFWLLKYDMAFKSIRAKKQHRYSGLLLITGYIWLMITALIFIMWNRLQFGYDLLIHSFFIGFVFSMIFSHAPIILPAVSGVAVKLYRPVLYVWFVLLQFSLIVRIGAGIVENSQVRKIAGFLNGMVILLFFITIVVIMNQEMKKKNSSAKT